MKLKITRYDIELDEVEGCSLQLIAHCQTTPTIRRSIGGGWILYLRRNLSISNAGDVVYLAGKKSDPDLMEFDSPEDAALFLSDYLDCRY